MTQRLPVIVFALVHGGDPARPGLPPFWIVLLDNIGLSALVALGLVLLTGVGGLTSFGQAAFVGLGAYTTAVLTTRLRRVALADAAAVARWSAASPRCCSASSRCGCRATTCRSAPSPGASALFYLFGNLEFLGK